MCNFIIKIYMLKFVSAVIGGAVVGLLCAILVVMFIVYRMRKKDEGSYALDEPRRSPATQTYPKPGAPHHNREFYAWGSGTEIVSVPSTKQQRNDLPKTADRFFRRKITLR